MSRHELIADSTAIAFDIAESIATPTPGLSGGPIARLAGLLTWLTMLAA